MESRLALNFTNFASIRAPRSTMSFRKPSILDLTGLTLAAGWCALSKPLSVVMQCGAEYQLLTTVSRPDKPQATVLQPVA